MQEALNKLLELYKSTPRTERDKHNFEDVARHINYIHDTVGAINRLDEYEKCLIDILDKLSVTELANICGVSRKHIYTLLKTKSRLHIYKKFRG